MKIDITHNDIHEIAKTTAKILSRYIRSARGNEVTAESLEGIIEQGMIGFIEGRKERDRCPSSNIPYDDPQPTDTVYGC